MKGFNRASLISGNKEFLKDLNKIIFDFIWNGKDKVKCFVLTSDIEDGEHLDSIVETQRVPCCETTVARPFSVIDA